MEIVRYFHSASMRGEESRQVLYLVGPVGSGKSSLMEALKKALEQKRTYLCFKRVSNAGRAAAPYTQTFTR